MLSVTLFKVAPHRANAIDKRAIANLRCHLENRNRIRRLKYKQSRFARRMQLHNR